MVTARPYRPTTVRCRNIPEVKEDSGIVAVPADADPDCRWRLPLFDDSGTVGARDGRALQSCSPALAGIIGGLRWWTALMISALSIPWR